MGLDGVLQDSFSLPVTTSSQPCVDAIGKYYEAVLAYKPFSAWAVAEEAVRQDPRSPLARVLAADYAFCSGDAARAKALLEECSAEAGGEIGASWTERERQYVRAWGRWCLESDPVGCYEVLKEVVDKQPQDLFAVKRGNIMGLIIGDGDRILAITEVAVAAAPSDPPPRYLHGMWAFALEQQGQYEEAEKRAQEGLKYEAELGPDAWLHHGLAHALYFQGEERADEALEFLRSRSAGWSTDALHPFLYTHNWWHLALLYVEQRQFGEAIKIFDERLWADSLKEMQQDPQVHLNAMNLLWRLDTRGQKELTLPRWKKVMDGCVGITLPKEDGSKAPCQHADLLIDVLLVRGFCALTAGGDTQRLDKWLRLVAANAEAMAQGSGEGARDRAEAYEACARSTAELFRTDIPEASVAGRHAKARDELRRLQPRWGCLGNSVEQRSVLLEAIEGPLVSGAPETNYDTLFR